MQGLLRSSTEVLTMKKFYAKLCDFEVDLSGSCLLGTVVVIFLAAIARVCGQPVTWGFDAALLLFTWGVFVGADAAYREGKMVYVDIFLERFPLNWHKPTKLIVYLIIAVFLLALTYLGFILSVRTWHRSFQGIPALSYTWVTLSVPISSVLMLVTTAIKIRKEVILQQDASDKSSTAI
jgi:TRAP-type C4-dicarboxylate transport system permease small subunit